MDLSEFDTTVTFANIKTTAKTFDLILLLDVGSPSDAADIAANAANLYTYCLPKDAAPPTVRLTETITLKPAAASTLTYTVETTLKNLDLYIP